MEINPEIDDGVSTINKNILDLLAKKDYPPSRIAMVINRSIDDKKYKTYRQMSGFRKGHLIEGQDRFHYFSCDNSVESDGKKISYPSFTMPSVEGSKIIYSLDEMVLKYDPRTLKEGELYNLLAIMVVAVGSAHAFPDGTGRTAVGLIDVMLRKYLGKKIELEKLQRLDDRLTSAMSAGSLIMLPKEYNPNEIMTTMQSGDVQTVIIPSAETHTTEQVQAFAKSYSDSILTCLLSLNPKNIDISESDNFSLGHDSITPIADLLKEVSFPTN